MYLNYMLYIKVVSNILIYLCRTNGSYITTMSYGYIPVFLIKPYD
jgi:hypothetical protein